ncbi:MAG: hypothetical protein AABP62_23275 [Planctomycetota bacterium]
MKSMLSVLLSVLSVLPNTLLPLPVFAADDDVVVVVDDWRANGVSIGSNDEAFERLIFSQDGNAQRARFRINADLERAINNLDRKHHLTDIQKKKLMLAGRGARKQFFDRVEVIRRKFVPAPDGQMLTDEDNLEIRLLQTQVTLGLLDSESFFSKTVRTTLNEEQRARFVAAIDERQRLHHRALVEATLVTVARNVKLRSSQRDAITKLLLEETVTSTARLDTDNMLMVYQFAELAESRVKPLLDDNQWQDLQSPLTQFREFEPILRRKGLLGSGHTDAVAK